MTTEINLFDTPALRARIDKALDEIRPHLQADGGDIEIVEVTEAGQLIIRWLGNCQS